MYWFLLLLFSSTLSIEKVDGLELISSTIRKSASGLREDVVRVGFLQQLREKSYTIRWSDRSRGVRSSHNDISFEPNGSHSPMKRQSRATGDSLCRAPDGHFLPIDLFALDTCARCYRYIPDHPSYFHRNSKWNHTLATVHSLQSGSAGILFNVTFLVHHGYNMTVSGSINYAHSLVLL